MRAEFEASHRSEVKARSVFDLARHNKEEARAKLEKAHDKLHSAWDQIKALRTLIQTQEECFEEMN